MLIDPLPASEWAHVSEDRLRILRWGMRLSRRGALLARLGGVRMSLTLLSGGRRWIRYAKRPDLHASRARCAAGDPEGRRRKLSAEMHEQLRSSLRHVAPGRAADVSGDGGAAWKHV